MPVLRCHDPERLERLLRRHEAAHVYAIADLDPHYFELSRWWILQRGGRDVAAAFVIDDFDPPLLSVLDPTGDGHDRELLDAIDDDLPDQMFVNLMPGGPEHLAGRFWFDDDGPYDKFAVPLGELDLTTTSLSADVRPIGLDDLDAIFDLLAATPDSGRVFVPEMMGDDTYVGVWERDELVAMAGTHVMSDRRRVAAIGNVITRADHRRRGLGAECTVAVLRRLEGRVDLVGLNCALANPGARRIYERLGFRPVLGYVEGTLHRRG